MTSKNRALSIASTSRNADLCQAAYDRLGGGGEGPALAFLLVLDGRGEHLMADACTRGSEELSAWLAVALEQAVQQYRARKARREPERP